MGQGAEGLGGRRRKWTPRRLRGPEHGHLGPGLPAEHRLLERRVRCALHPLRPGREYEGRDAVLEVAAGVGGGEACVFAEQVLGLYMKYAASLGYSVTVLDKESGDKLPGILRAEASIRGGGNVFSMYDLFSSNTNL